MENKIMDDLDVEKIDFVPRACQGTAENPAKYEGKIVLRMPDFEERIGLLDKLADLRPKIKVDDDATDDEEIAKSREVMKILIACVKLAEPFVLGVNIRRISDGKEISSFKRLKSNQDFDQDLPTIIEQIAQSGLIEKK